MHLRPGAGKKTTTSAKPNQLSILGSVMTVYCVWVWAYVYDTDRGQKRVSVPLELQLQVVVSDWISVLGT